MGVSKRALTPTLGDHTRWRAASSWMTHQMNHQSSESSQLRPSTSYFTFLFWHHVLYHREFSYRSSSVVAILTPSTLWALDKSTWSSSKGQLQWQCFGGNFADGGRERESESNSFIMPYIWKRGVFVPYSTFNGK